MTIEDPITNSADHDLQSTEEGVWIAIATTIPDKAAVVMDIDLDHHLLAVGMGEEVLIGMSRDDEADQDLHSDKEDASRAWIRDLHLTMIVLCQDEDLSKYLIFRSFRSNLQSGL